MMKKFLCLLMVIAIASLSLFSCGEQAASMTVKLSFTAGSDQIFSEDITLEAVNPSVIDVVNEAIVFYGLNAEVDAEGRSVDKASYYYDTEKDGLSYYWEYTINGTLPESGMANSNYVTDGDVIEYNFMIYNPDTDKYVSDDSLIEFFTYDEEELAAIAESESLAIAESESLAAAETAEEETIDMSEFLEEDELDEE